MMPPNILGLGSDRSSKSAPVKSHTSSSFGSVGQVVREVTGSSNSFGLISSSVSPSTTQTSVFSKLSAVHAVFIVPPFMSNSSFEPIPQFSILYVPELPFRVMPIVSRELV